MGRSIGVVSPSLILTVTVEVGDEGGDEIHLHPGGQGFWVARMIEHLGEAPILCAPLGGEVGLALRSLIPDGIELWAIDTQHDSPMYIHDRRSGDRVPVSQTDMPMLSRHEQDDYYSRALEAAMATELIVVTGRFEGGGLPLDFFTRLASDLGAIKTSVVADLHGEELDAFLDGGPLRLLKVSTDDLKADGLISDPDDVAEAVSSIMDRGVENVVVSGADRGTQACLGKTWFLVHQPALEVADHRGSGDSMTAALAVGLARDMDEVSMLALGAAAGGANAVRRGLGNADRDLIVQLADLVEVEKMNGSEHGQ